MKDVLDHIKKTIGLEEEGNEETEEQETIIVPEPSFYEIILMKAKTLDDFDYALNQIVEEKTPVILDMKYLERDNPKDFKVAGEKLKEFRHKTGGEAILLCKNGKNTIIITPPEIKLIRK